MKTSREKTTEKGQILRERFALTNSRRARAPEGKDLPLSIYYRGVGREITPSEAGSRPEEIEKPLFNAIDLREKNRTQGEPKNWDGSLRYYCSR